MKDHVKKKFIISQIYIPFIYNLAKRLDEEIIILINSHSEYLLAQLIKLRRKSVTRIIRLQNSIDHSYSPDLQYLERLRGDIVKFPDQETLRSINITELDCCLLTWNSCEFLERYLIDIMKVPAVIFELGYFRPNSLIIGNAFTKHFPSYFLNLNNIKIDTYGINKTIIDHAWLEKTNNITKLFKLTLSFELYFNKLRPRSFMRDLKGNFLKIYGPIALKVLIFLSRLKDTKQEKKILSFFDQDPRDSSLLLDELYINREENIKRLIEDAKKHQYHMIYRPHPLALDLKMAWYFYKEGMSIEIKGLSKVLIDKSHIVSTYNSTVGFEALMTDKPIIVLGNAFYRDNSGVFESLDDFIKGDNGVIQESRNEYINIIKNTHHFILEPN